MDAPSAVGSVIIAWVSPIARKQATPPLRFLFVLFVPVQAPIVTFFFFWGDFSKYLSSPQIEH